MSAKPGPDPRLVAPAERVRVLVDRPAVGSHVLYWMTYARRARANHALQHAAAWARALEVPLTVLEALEVDHPHASARFHRFIVEGMAANARAFAGRVAYHPYLEPAPGAARGLLAALADDAAVVVTDDAPVFFLPRIVAAAARRLDRRFEAIDGYGLLPLAATDRVFLRAVDLRRFMQRNLPAHLDDAPHRAPLRGLPPPRPIPAAVTRRWQAFDVEDLRPLASLPIDHRVGPAVAVGGTDRGRRRLRSFVEDDLDVYHEVGNDPSADRTSRLSPYLHFGHIGAHEVFDAVARQEGWDLGRIADKADGSRRGWWGMRPGAEAFLDQLVTWRELGANAAYHRDDVATPAFLPEWAKRTLLEHADDPREHVYDLATFEAAATHDPVWNAAQRQLLAEGRVHNYMRMLWGKKILEWTEHPWKAAEIMVTLNDRWALDGRDPNSYSGIFWVLGRYDRAWGPERPIFGKVRYMSSGNTRRKFRLGPYLERWGGDRLL